MVIPVNPLQPTEDEEVREDRSDKFYRAGHSEGDLIIRKAPVPAGAPFRAQEIAKACWWYAVANMTAEEVIKLLQLTPLELEGGFFRETYRSRWQVSAEYLPEGTRGSRSIGTAIYYMITPESFSTLHRLPGTEVFHFYMGDPVVMLQLHLDGTSRTVTLGTDLANGQEPQVVVRGNVWQGCRLASGEWALLGTTMSPGFDYADYTTGVRDELMAQYPEAAEMIREYAKSS
jgi:predicted cupin superfamily sugar epimerase